MDFGRLAAFSVILAVVQLFIHAAQSYERLYRNPVTMTCKQKFMKAEMSLPASLNHPRLQIHLLDPNCRPTITNATHISFQIQLDGCSTQHMNLGDLIIYHNRVIFKERLRHGRVFPRKPEIHFPIQCLYIRDKNLINSRTPVLKSLQIDHARSSANRLPHVKGIPLTLSCVFQYGAPPISSKLVKIRTMNGSVQHPTLQQVLARGGREIFVALDVKKETDFGEYRCRARDARGDTVTHKIQLHRVDPSNITKNGISVTCYEDQSRIRLDLRRSHYPWLSQVHFHVHLRDPSCEIQHVNKTHISIVAPLRYCGTIKTESYHRTLYSNELTGHVYPDSGLKIPDFRFPVNCVYRRASQSRIELNRQSHVLQGSTSHFHGNDTTTYGLFRHGETMRAVCHVDKYDTFIGWQVLTIFDNKTNDRVVIKNAELTISRLNASDGGLYLCSTKYANLSLYIYIEAEMSLPEIQYLALGKSGVISCSVKGFPVPEVLWVINGKIFKSKSKGYLRINDVTKDDGGIYTCISEQVINPSKGWKIRKNMTTTVKVHEKLAVNNRGSSPSVVRTFLGFHTTLICAFINGVPAIVLTLTKDQLTLKTIQEQSTNGTLELSVTSFGKYICNATDFTGTVAKHVIEVRQARPQHFITYGMNVVCHESFMEVHFDRLLYPWLDSRNFHMHLIDPACDSYSITGQWLTIKVPLNGCGTQYIHEGDVIKYVNTFMCHVLPSPDRLISRVPDVWFPFNCTYGRGHPLTVIDALPLGRLKVDKSQSSPSEVTALLGTKVTIKCEFVGGVLPYEMSLRKRKKLLMHEKVSRQPKLSFVVTSLRRDLGKYTCRIVDSIGRSVKHEIMLTKTDLSEISYSKLGVKCHAGYILLTLKRKDHPWIHTDHMSIHLKDDACEPFYFNRTDVLVKIPLTGCGTRYYQTRDSVIYYNKLIISQRLDPGQVISRLPVIEFPFNCKYKRSGFVGG